MRIANDAVFWDVGVAGDTPVQNRTAFSHSLQYCLDNGIKDLLFEDPSRLARCVVTQELALDFMASLDIQPIAVNSPECFLEDSLYAKMIRQMLAVMRHHTRPWIRQ